MIFNNGGNNGGGSNGKPTSPASHFLKALGYAFGNAGGNRARSAGPRRPQGTKKLSCCSAKRGR